MSVHIEDPRAKSFYLSGELGLGTFAVGTSKRPVKPKSAGGMGFYDGTSDLDELAELWANHPGAFVAVRTDRPEDQIGCLDIDTDHRTGQPVGLESLADAGHWLDHESSISYRTQHAGEHNIFRVPAPAPAPKTILPGVDRKTGGSYFIWYGNDLPTREEWEARTLAPAWFLKGRAARYRSSPVSAAEDAEASAWIASLTAGPPIESMVVDLPEYNSVLPVLTSFVSYARMLPNQPGLLATYEALRDSYVCSPGASSERPAKWDRILRWALGKTESTPDLTVFLARYSRGSGQGGQGGVVNK